MNREYWYARRSQWAWKRWIGLLIAAIGGLTVIAGLAKSLYLFVATVPLLARPLQHMVWLVYHFVFDWPALRVVWEGSPIFNLRNHVDPGNIAIAAVYFVAIFGAGYFRANHARVRWLDGLEQDALEQDIRDGFRGRQRDPVQAPSSPAPFPSASYAREKFHDRYLAPFAVGVVLLLMQYGLTLFAGK
jgi:hypothetical protein